MSGAVGQLKATAFIGGTICFPSAERKTRAREPRYMTISATESIPEKEAPPLKVLQEESQALWELIPMLDEKGFMLLISRSTSGSLPYKAQAVLEFFDYKVRKDPKYDLSILKSIDPKTLDPSVATSFLYFSRPLSKPSQTRARLSYADKLRNCYRQAGRSDLISKVDAAF